MAQTHNVARLRGFIGALAELLDQQLEEPAILDRGAQLLGDLVSHDDWLSDEFAQPSPERYQQYVLHVDSAQRFSVLSFVWGPGQETPVHDHRVWGLIGMLRGGEDAQGFRRDQSIHVYGGNIGAVKRAVYLADGSEKPFISGYSNAHLPNIWDLSKENPTP